MDLTITKPRINLGQAIDSHTRGLDQLGSESFFQGARYQASTQINTSNRHHQGQCRKRENYLKSYVRLKKDN